MLFECIVKSISKIKYKIRGNALGAMQYTNQD